MVLLFLRLSVLDISVNNYPCVGLCSPRSRFCFPLDVAPEAIVPVPFCVCENDRKQVSCIDLQRLVTLANASSHGLCTVMWGLIKHGRNVRLFYAPQSFELYLSMPGLSPRPPWPRPLPATSYLSNCLSQALRHLEASRSLSWKRSPFGDLKFTRSLIQACYLLSRPPF